MPAEVIMSAEQQMRDLPADPIVFGALAFGLLLLLVLGVLMFGKGRPHS